jgi:hypothetical protein
MEIGLIELSLILSGNIGSIGEVPDTFSVTDSKVSIGYPMTSATDRKGRIELYRHRLRSVTKCHRLKLHPNYHLYCTMLCSLR